MRAQRRPRCLHVVSRRADHPGQDRRLDPTGAVAVFRTTVDDYAEIWVNGVIPGRSGYPRPGRDRGPQHVPNLENGGAQHRPQARRCKFQIAIFGINGPISMAPANSVFVRDHAQLQLFK